MCHSAIQVSFQLSFPNSGTWCFSHYGMIGNIFSMSLSKYSVVLKGIAKESKRWVLFPYIPQYDLYRRQCHLGKKFKNETLTKCMYFNFRCKLWSILCFLICANIVDNSQIQKILINQWLEWRKLSVSN